MKNKNWYEKGLRFQCTGCGKCCTGSPGYVWVNEEEMQKIATHLNLSLSDFKKRYIRQVNSRFSLVEMKKNYDCIFLRDRKCLIYEVRPTQCQTYPFWPENLISKEAWEETAKTCEGICADGPQVSLDAIEEQRLIQLKRHENS